MFLVDTNIWLERLLEQEKTEEVKLFLQEIPADILFISDFTLHSIGIIMTKLNRKDEFKDFLVDIFENGKLNYLSLRPLELPDLITYINSKRLDFDDAYQVVVSKKYKLEIVSFDKDFEKAGIKPLKPFEAINKYKKIA